MNFNKLGFNADKRRKYELIKHLSKKYLENLGCFSPECLLRISLEASEIDKENTIENLEQVNIFGVAHLHLVNISRSPSYISNRASPS